MNKQFLFGCLVLAATLFSCKKECEKENYGTLVITNNTNCEYKIIIASSIDTIPFFFVQPGSDTSLNLQGGINWRVARNCTGFVFDTEDYEIENCKDYTLLIQ